MSLPTYPTGYLDIFNNSDFPRELLNSPSYAENYILVVGPNLARQEAAHDHGHTPTYLGRLLERMVEWCVQENVIQQQDTINDLRTLLYNGALVQVGYKIEEYLATPQQKQQCLSAVLHPYNQVKEIHYHLAHIPFRGYITTGYDTCIETAYAEIHHNQLRKFYKPFLSRAVKACRNKQPFILKLYGDLDDSDSITLGHRLLTGLYAEDDRDQLRQLFSGVSSLFIGFEKADLDLDVLKSLAKDKIIVHQKYPDRALELEKVESNDLLETGTFTKSFTISYESLSHSRMLLAVHNPPQDTKEASRKASSTSPRSPSAEQDSQEETQQENKIPITVFIFYAPKDNKYKIEIEKVLNGLKNKKGKPFDIICGSLALGESIAYKTDMKHPLTSKDLVILLISRDFMGSKYYDKEQIQEVVERHGKGAWICPILVRPYNWEGYQFDELTESILPSNRIPITKWRPQDDAYVDISEGLEYALDYLASRRSPSIGS